MQYSKGGLTIALYGGIMKPFSSYMLHVSESFQEPDYPQNHLLVTVQQTAFLSVLNTIKVSSNDVLIIINISVNFCA